MVVSYSIGTVGKMRDADKVWKNTVQACAMELYLLPIHGSHGGGVSRGRGPTSVDTVEERKGC